MGSESESARHQTFATFGSLAQLIHRAGYLTVACSPGPGRQDLRFNDECFLERRDEGAYGALVWGALTACGSSGPPLPRLPGLTSCATAPARACPKAPVRAARPWRIPPRPSKRRTPRGLPHVR
jgi:hypothetical protein